MSTIDEVINSVDPEFCRGMLWVVWQAPDVIDDLLNHEELSSEEKTIKYMNLLIYLGLIQINTTINGSFRVTLTVEGLKIAQWVA